MAVGKDKAKRFDNKKLRHDLVPTFAQEQYVTVLTKGAIKYGDRNWEKGMAWSRCVASLKRHLAAFERGDNYDGESGQLHTAHIMTNAAFLTEYFKTYQEGDNRKKNG